MRLVHGSTLRAILALAFPGSSDGHADGDSKREPDAHISGEHAKHGSQSGPECDS
jgi:hypothetical protein